MIEHSVEEIQRVKAVYEDPYGSHHYSVNRRMVIDMLDNLLAHLEDEGGVRFSYGQGTKRTTPNPGWGCTLAATRDLRPIEE